MSDLLKYHLYKYVHWLRMIFDCRSKNGYRCHICRYDENDPFKFVCMRHLTIGFIIFATCFHLWFRTVSTNKHVEKEENNIDLYPFGDQSDSDTEWNVTTAKLSLGTTVFSMCRGAWLGAVYSNKQLLSVYSCACVNLIRAVGISV